MNLTLMAMKAQKTKSVAKKFRHSSDLLTVGRAIQDIQIKPGSILDRMGGLPDCLVYGPEDSSTKAGRRREVSAYLSEKAKRKVR